MTIEVLRTVASEYPIPQHLHNTNAELEQASLVIEEMTVGDNFKIVRVVKNRSGAVTTDVSINELFNTLLASPVTKVTTRRLLKAELF